MIRCALSLAAILGPGCYDWSYLSAHFTDDGGARDGGCAGCAAGGPYNYVFVTSLTYLPGQLGGLGGADRACQERAAAAHLPGAFKAWLATSAADARARFATARGWIRPDGRPFGDSISAILQGQIYFPPRLDEQGTDLLSSGASDIAVATGTDVDGALASGNNCMDWTSTSQGYASGVPFATNEEWTGNHGSRVGSLTAHLYCFGIDYATPLALTPAVGRLAFLSSGSFSPTGETAADAICNGEAHTNGHAGDFAALLSTRAKPAAMLFDLAGPTWVRPDGIPWLASAADLAQGKFLTSLNVRFPDSGTTPVYESYRLAFTGSASPAAASITGNESCTDWTSTSGSATVGHTWVSNGQLWRGTSNVCNDGSVKLYCLER